MRRTPLDSWILQKIEAQEPLTRRSLEEYQLVKLQKTLEWVRNKSPFYRETLADCPTKFSNLGELQQLPFTTAAHICNDPLRFVCVSQSDIGRVVTLDTSGTTGNPKRLYFTIDDQELTRDFFHIGMSTLAEPGDVVLILLPGATPGSVGDLLADGLKRLGALPVKHGPVKDEAEVLQLIRSQKVDCLVGVPVQVMALERMRQMSGGESIKMKSMLLTTDNVPPAVIHLLQNNWGVEVFNHYGMTEMGLGGGVECAAHRGYHLREGDMLFEIIDPTSGRQLPDGESGEVVFTTLTRRGMPLIRYRTGDISRFIPGNCPCGSSLKNLEIIRDRLCGFRKLSTGRLSMSQLDEALLSIPGLLNFTAGLSGAPGSQTLSLQVDLPGAGIEEVQQAVETALSTISPIRSSLQAGNLRIVARPAHLPKGSMAKRTLNTASKKSASS